MSEKMREEFEEWMILDGCSRDLRKAINGDYFWAETNFAWRVWQASREALVIELPKLENSNSYYGGGDQRDAKIMECRKAIEAAGGGVMEMTRQDSFEAHWADVHDLPVSTMAQYRFAEKDGYRLPDMAKGYRNFCAGWDALLAKQEIEREQFLEHISDFEQEETA